MEAEPAKVSMSARAAANVESMMMRLISATSSSYFPRPTAEMGA
jgi:hypothetical protein